MGKNADMESIRFVMMFHLKKARAAVSAGDYEKARYEYRSGVNVLINNNINDEEILPEYENFVKSDPGFKKLADVFIAGIKDNPGITESDIFVMGVTKTWGEKYGYGKPIEPIENKYFLDFGEKLGYIKKTKKENKIYLELME